MGGTPSKTTVGRVGGIKSLRVFHALGPRWQPATLSERKNTLRRSGRWPLSYPESPAVVNGRREDYPGSFDYGCGDVVRQASLDTSRRVGATPLDTPLRGYSGRTDVGTLLVVGPSAKLRTGLAVPTHTPLVPSRCRRHRIEGSRSVEPQRTPRQSPDNRTVLEDYCASDE